MKDCTTLVRSVDPANLDHFVWSAIGTQVAGIAFTPTVTAQDAYDNTTTKDESGSAFGATESVTFSSTATAAPDATVPTYAGGDLTDDEADTVDLSSGSFVTDDIILYNAS